MRKNNYYMKRVYFEIVISDLLVQLYSIMLPRVRHSLNARQPMALGLLGFGFHFKL